MRHRPTLYPRGANRFRVMQVLRSLYGWPIGPIQPTVPTMSRVEPTLDEWVVFWLSVDEGTGSEMSPPPED